MKQSSVGYIVTIFMLRKVVGLFRMTLLCIVITAVIEGGIACVAVLI